MLSSSQFKILAITILISASSCKGKKKEYHNLIHKIEAQSIQYDRDSIQNHNLFDMNELVENLNVYRKTLKGDFEQKVSKLNELTKEMINIKKG